MKKILFLTLVGFENIEDRGIYYDLVKTLSETCEVYVVTPREKKTNLETELAQYKNIKVLKVKTGNVTQCKSLLEKGLSTLMIERQYMKAINKYFTGVRFDLVLYSTPPITFTNIIRKFQKTHNSKTYLMLKDIFPQNAVDIGFIKENGFLHKYFRKKEIDLYNVSDKVGCTSENNINFIKKHNPTLCNDKIVICRNSIDPRPSEYFKRTNIARRSLNIPDDAVIFLYGGNLGKPQAIDFLLLFADNFHRVQNSYLLIVGKGSEYNRIDSYIKNNNPKNVILLNGLPKKEYNAIMTDCDVGLVFLDHRFTVPNNPARFTEYMEASMPMLAATDTATDTREWLEDKKIGFWVESKQENIEDMIKKAQILANDSKLRTEYGRNGRMFLEEKFTTKETAKAIITFLENNQNGDHR